MPLVSTGGMREGRGGHFLKLSSKSESRLRALLPGPFNVMDYLISHKSSIEYNIDFLCLEDIDAFF